MADFLKVHLTKGMQTACGRNDKLTCTALHSEVTCVNCLRTERMKDHTITEAERMTMKAARLIVVLSRTGKTLEERAHTFDSEGEAIAVAMWLLNNGVTATRMNSTTYNKLKLGFQDVHYD